MDILLFVLLCLGCVFANWGLEIAKWHLLTNEESGAEWQRAIQSVIGALALGLVTPARLGEIPGRAYLYSAERKEILVFKALFSSFMQNIWNIGVGSFAFLSLRLLASFPGIDRNRFSFSFALLQLLILVVVVSFLDRLPVFLSRRKNAYLRSWGEKTARVITGISNWTKWYVWGLSGLRYVVYLFQYVAVMAWLVPQIPIGESAAMAAVLFMVQTLLPMPALLALPARGELAVLGWGMLGVSPIEALLGSTCLWILNLGLPAIAGGWFLFKNALFETYGRGNTGILRDSH